jgi:hypothetical protein
MSARLVPLGINGFIPLLGRQTMIAPARASSIMTIFSGILQFQKI